MTCGEAAKILRAECISNLPSSVRVTVTRKQTSLATTSEKLELGAYINEILDKPAFGVDEDSQGNFIQETARKDLSKQYDTTQIFIAPAGDWSKGVTEDVQSNNHGRSCWVTGTFTSPYSIAHDFS